MEKNQSVVVSDELFAPVQDGIDICYQTFGDAGDDPLLLVQGLAGPMLWWDEKLCELLATKGFFVIRYDNRDTGRSSRAKGRVTRSDLTRAFLGRRVQVPYSLSDMAQDGVGLLDHLGIDAAHVAGVSMGGMIGQTLAVEHPDRVRSLTSIMSTTGRRAVGWQHPALLPRMLARRQTTREGYVDTSATFWKYIGSPSYPDSEERLRARAGDTFDRGISPAGIMRQMLAVITQRNRTAGLGRVSVPVTVVHGTADKMVHVSGGKATASAIRGSVLQVIDGMGHDLPPSLWPTLADAIRRTADRA